MYILKTDRKIRYYAYIYVRHAKNHSNSTVGFSDMSLRKPMTVFFHSLSFEIPTSDHRNFWQT
ncbi:hypothetical protein KK467_29320, partial [Klebsiella pneumoniae]|uniref:hypothetical protein n=1 Tax=Klebsiella pneumoniae TaxID=573 RepID=UPI001BDF8DAD